jgi:Protein of unknown function (DUF3300)
MVFRTLSSRLTAVMCAIALVPDSAPATPSEPASQQADSPAQEAPKIPNDQLDSLVAPIALYPDPLLAQVLAASTYPLELIQLQQWLEKNKGLKDKALVDAVQKQPWDPSIQAMAALPDVVKRLTDDIQWTTDLGNAFLAQQSDVMDAVQRMRSKAKETGNLQSNEQMKVETKVIEKKSVVVIEQSSPDVVYVPSYNPTVVYGAPAYPYPPIYYPPPGYYAAGMAISFGIGVAMGAAWGGGWGWGANWGGNNDVTINNNNNFNRTSNVNGGNRTNNIGNSNRSGNSNWKHSPQHRGGAPYSNRATANKYGGTARGDSMANRQTNARQRQQQSGLNNRASDGQSKLAASRGGVGDSAGNRPAAGTRDASRSGGGDRVGNRDASPGSNAGSRGGAFGDSSRSASSARTSSSRGASSMGGSRGGGARGGGRRR